MLACVGNTLFVINNFKCSNYLLTLHGNKSLFTAQWTSKLQTTFKTEGEGVKVHIILTPPPSFGMTNPRQTKKKIEKSHFQLR